MARRPLPDLIFEQHRREGFVPGDEAAHRAASALADRFDAPTIIALTDAMAFLELMGGQLYAVTLRERLNAEGRLAKDGEPGDYVTAVMRLEYESRDARVVEAPEPDEVLGIEVTDFSKAPTRLEPEAPAPPEDENDLRDDEPAEADASADQDEPVALVD